jgi:aminopeptidase N
MLPLLLALQIAAPPNDALRYDITLVPADTGTHLLGEVETAWRLASADPVAVQLDSSMRVVRVLIDGKPNTRLSRTMYGRSEDDLVVPHQKAAGDSITTRIRYHGFARGGTRLATGPGEARTFVAVGSGARSWLPVPLDPRFERVTATFRIQTSVGQQAIAPGVLEKVDTLPYDHAVWRYRMDEPAPVPALAVASGSYRIRSLTPGRCGDGCPLVEVWSLGDSAAVGNAWEMVEFFAGKVGRYPYPRLVHVEAAVPAAFAAPGIVLHPQGSLSGAGPADSVLALATARQWFGVAVSAAAAEDQVLVDALARVLAEAWRDRKGKPSKLVPRDSIASMDRAGTELRLLRQRAGDGAFFAGLRAFAEAHWHRSASRADFARAMSAASGRDVQREMPFTFDRAR